MISPKDFDQEDWTIIKRIKGNQDDDESFIDLIQWQQRYYILKLNKHSSYNILWEYRVASIIRQNLSGMIHLSRNVDLVSLTVKIDEFDKIYGYKKDVDPVTHKIQPTIIHKKTIGILIDYHENATQTLANLLKETKNLKLLFSR